MPRSKKVENPAMTKEQLLDEFLSKLSSIPAPAPTPAPTVSSPIEIPKEKTKRVLPQALKSWIDQVKAVQTATGKSYKEAIVIASELKKQGKL